MIKVESSPSHFTPASGLGNSLYVFSRKDVIIRVTNPVASFSGRSEAPVESYKHNKIAFKVFYWEPVVIGLPSTLYLYALGALTIFADSYEVKSGKVRICFKALNPAEKKLPKDEKFSSF